MAPKINAVQLHQPFRSISLSTPSSLPHRHFSCSRSLPRLSQSIPRPSQSRRVGAGAPVYLATVLEYLPAEVSLTKRVNNRGSCCQAKNNDDDDEIPSWIKPSKEMNYLAKLLKYYEPLKDINGFFTTFVSLYNFVAFMYKLLQRLLKTKKKTEAKNGEEEVDKEETKKDEGKQEKKETNKDDENDEVNEGKKMDYDWDDVAKVTLIFKVQILIQAKGKT